MTDSTAQPTPASAEPHVAVPSQPQDDFNPVRARRKISGLEKQLQESQERLAALEAGQKTEAERAREEAYNRGKSETQTQADARLKQQQLENTITRKVLAAGLHEDAIDLALVKLQKAGIDDPTEAEIGDVLATLEWAKPASAQQQAAPRAPGQPGSPTPADVTRPEYPRGGEWDRTQIQELIANGEYPKYQAAIEKAHKEGRVKAYPLRAPR